MEKFEDFSSLKIFDSLIEELRQLICERDIKSEEELERFVSMLFIIGIDKLETDDINSVLNVVMKYLKENTSNFPSLTILEYVKKVLEFFCDKRLKNNGEQLEFYVSLSWPNDLRIVIQRLFQTFKLPQEYLDFCYELSELTSQAIGPNWLKTDGKFAALIASLTSGRLRILMQNEDEINMEHLITSLSLLEDVMHCAEDEEKATKIDDKTATSIGKSTQEAVVFLCECVLELSKRYGDYLQERDILLVISRFLYAFFHIGGWKIVDAELLKSTLPVLIRTRDCPNMTGTPYVATFDEILKEIS